MNGNGYMPYAPEAEAPPYWNPRPPSPGDSLRLLQHIARRGNSPTGSSSPPQNVSPYGLSRADQALEEAFSRLNVDSGDDYHHYHRHQPSYYPEFRSSRSPYEGNGCAVPSDTNAFEWFESDPYLSYGVNEQSFVINSSPLSTPTYAYSNASSSNSFGDSYGPANGTVGRNLDTWSYNVGDERHWRPQEHHQTFVAVESLRGKIAYLARNQNGCRILQNTMECLTSAREIRMIFDEVIGHVCELMLDPFGNYVVQKLVELCNEEQRTRIIWVLTRTNFLLVSICLNLHGTRVVQKLLEHVTSRIQVALFMEAVSPYAVALCKSANGQHVIQYCLRHFSDEDNAYLLNEVADNCIEVATDKSGCCVLQQCLEFSHGHVRNRLVDEIVANAVLLSEDRYGNYVVQYVLGLKIPDITTRLLIQLRGSYMTLSLGKYGSNVVEKCLRDCEEFQAYKIILELLNHPSVPKLLTDPFGNYVFQSSLSASKGEIRKTLINLVECNVDLMRSNLYGKKILAWLEKRKIVLKHNICTVQVRRKIMV